MPKHRKPTTPEAEIAAQFGAELKEFCRSQEVPVKRLAELTTYSQQYIYKILGSELPRRDLMEDIVTAVCDLHNYRPESKQETLDRWRVKWDTTYARLKEARASFESRLTGLNDGHESLQSQLDDLRQRIERLESEPPQPFEPRQERTLDLGRHRTPARPREEPAVHPEEPAVHREELRHIERLRLAAQIRDDIRAKREAAERLREAAWELEDLLTRLEIPQIPQIPQIAKSPQSPQVLPEQGGPQEQPGQE